MPERVTSCHTIRCRGLKPHNVLVRHQSIARIGPHMRTSPQLLQCSYYLECHSHLGREEINTLVLRAIKAVPVTTREKGLDPNRPPSLSLSPFPFSMTAEAYAALLRAFTCT
jgi:hypothetical protein